MAGHATFYVDLPYQSRRKTYRQSIHEEVPWKVKDHPVSRLTRLTKLLKKQGIPYEMSADFRGNTVISW